MIINVFILAAMAVTTARIKSFLRSKKFIIVAGFNSDPCEALKYIEENPSDILIIDDAFFSKTSISGFTQVKPAINAILYTGSTDPGYLEDLLEQGIKGIVHKRSKRTLLVEAIKKISENGNFVDKKIKFILNKTSDV